MLLTDLVNIEEDAVSTNLDICWELILDSYFLIFLAFLGTIHGEETRENMSAGLEDVVACDFKGVV